MSDIKLRKMNKGFTLIELIIAITIMVVLTGMAVPPMVRYVNRAREQRYMSEAEEICKAVKLYLIDQDEKGELPTFFEALYTICDSGKSPNDDSYILRPYLNGRATKDAWVGGISYSGTLESFKGIQYNVNGYIISVQLGHGVKIEQRPGMPKPTRAADTEK